MTKRYALIGASGYVAPRHMKAMKATGGTLDVAVDPNDSVGVMDSHFPDAVFFIEFERFDRYIDKLRRQGRGVDYVTICSPNYLHDAHCRFALRSGAHAICEKPLVLNPWNLDGLAEIERESGRSISTILQLRLHPSILQMKRDVEEGGRTKHEVDLTYVTSRGRWYQVSWKGDEGKSGGVVTNIGIHFFDMISFVFGPIESSVLHLRSEERGAGILYCANAKVRWFLSIDRNDLPDELPDGQTTFRSISIDGRELEFSTGFTDLHVASYQNILEGRGFGIEAVRPSIELVSAIRTMPLLEPGADAHPYLRRLIR